LTRAVGKRLEISGIAVDHPMMTRAEVEGFYQDPRVAESYERKRFASGWKQPEEIDALRHFATRARPKRLLDLASGTGRAVRGLADLARELTVAVDLSAPMLTANRAGPGASGVEYARANAFQLPLATESFDFVVCLRCIRHFAAEDRSAIYREIRRVLQPGGSFVLDAANRGLHASQLAERAIFDQVYAPDELAAELSEHGFELAELWGTLTGYERLAELLMRWRVPASLVTRGFHRVHRLLRARPAVVEGSYLWIARCVRK
jgi:ubiquinone/menaquinone biosynthesis C-methylase UbiE